MVWAELAFGWRVKLRVNVTSCEKVRAAPVCGVAETGGDLVNICSIRWTDISTHFLPQFEATQHCFGMGLGDAGYWLARGV